MTRQMAVPCTVMRGGTSKALYFLAEDLPTERGARDAFLLAAMGSPDPREIDGMGGGHPLTSKVAVVNRSIRPGIDVDYLFLQVWPDRAEVSDQQNCGNILAGVGPFALENGLLPAADGVTPVAIYLVNTDSKATAYVETPGGVVNYAGSARIEFFPHQFPASRGEIRCSSSSAVNSNASTSCPVAFRICSFCSGVNSTRISCGVPSDMERSG